MWPAFEDGLVALNEGKRQTVRPARNPFGDFERAKGEADRVASCLPTATLQLAEFCLHICYADVDIQNATGIPELTIGSNLGMAACHLDQADHASLRTFISNDDLFGSDIGHTPKRHLIRGISHGRSRLPGTHLLKKALVSLNRGDCHHHLAPTR